VNLVDHLLTKSHLELAKELAATAKENAALKERLARAETEIFWMKVSDRDDTEKPDQTA
jgi:hypothetical protein